MFIGSPIKHSEDELVAIGKKLKKNNIAVNIISYGNCDINDDKLDKFINAANNNNNSSKVSVFPGANILDVLITSSIIGADMDDMMGNMGGGEGQQGGNVMPQSQFDIDMQKAYELSNEEEKKRREAEKEKDKKVIPTDNATPPPDSDKLMDIDKKEDELSEEELLKLAMDMSKKEHEQQTNEVKKKDGMVLLIQFHFY